MWQTDNIVLEQIGEFNLFLRYFLFAFTQAKEMSFHLLAVQMVMKHLIFFQSYLFLSIVMSIGSKKSNK